MVSDILRPGNKVEIKAVQKIERQGSTGEVAHVYTSRIQEIHENGDIDISMPIEEGKYVLLHLGVRFEFVFYAEKNLYRAIGQVKERFKSNNIYMLKVELKTQLAKFQRREYYRFPCVMDMKYYRIAENESKERDTEKLLEHIQGVPDEEEKRATILDISGGGARFVSEEKFEANQFVLMELELISDKMDKQYHIKGRIVGWKKLEYREPRYETRIEFIMEDNKVREDIIRYIFEEERKNAETKKDNCMRNILVVDDSALMRRVICDIINTDKQFQANDVCRDGLEAYERLKTTSYDAVILDVNMPKMDGLQLLEKLQKDKIKATVIMVSTLTTRDAQTTILAMERGAVDFVQKPSNIIEAKGNPFKEQLLGVLRAVFETQQNVHRMPDIKPVTGTQPVRTPARVSHNVSGDRLIALACSTGGPKSLQSVIPFLPKEMNAPMVLVQHMPAGFTKTMADRLNEVSKVSVKEAQEGDVLQKGTVYIAPGGKHMLVKKMPGGGHKITLSDAAPIGGLKPCANVTYESLNDCAYDEIVCVILTGMGADGTQGIIELQKHKKVHTIAQDAKSCVVYGMPKAIAEAGAADEIVPLTEIAQAIIKNVGVK